MVKGSDCAPEMLGSATHAAHTVQALCWQTLAVVHFYTSGSTKPAKLDMALRGCPHHSHKCYLNHPKVLLSPLHLPAHGLAKLLNQRKVLKCMHALLKEQGKSGESNL